jgi:hypothetical protein
VRCFPCFFLLSLPSDGLVESPLLTHGKNGGKKSRRMKAEAAAKEGQVVDEKNDGKGDEKEGGFTPETDVNDEHKDAVEKGKWLEA